MSPLEPAELRRRRRALGLTQAELAERLAVSANTVARWERGELRVGHPQQVARLLARLERANTVAFGAPDEDDPAEQRRVSRLDGAASAAPAAMPAYVDVAQYPFGPAELLRLEMHRVAVEAGFYNERPVDQSVERQSSRISSASSGDHVRSAATGAPVCGGGSHLFHNPGPTRVVTHSVSSRMST